MFTAGKSLSITGGHCDRGGYRPDLGDEPSWKDGIVNGPEEARAAVRYQIKYGADVIKVCATAGVMSAGSEIGPAQTTLDELRAIVETAHMLNPASDRARARPRGHREFIAGRGQLDSARIGAGR